ncbi:GHMP family kinase ATP-binding protein [Candidatus Atelocyanobacterium thalassae]|uniref:D-glycero-alpha-D-manno-heptose 7-phosphate kinase n=1 Tax=cyanobacterium endosymbiont of Braarudosphaera bigelowii TaxID=1285375 RepID=A0ABM7U4Q3_9CHRO|nr:GHMP kinase [Candidatus Atelocyanobacterium thalassa]BDA39350.1 D-glycero-alpha-D-manno-heptose 7-phosphate kinase [cyanobacterium endosymbiont of Braarudosphaera bigelowii]
MLIARAPVRISFFGGGTDYPEHFLRHGGAVLSTAIDKFSYVTASPFPSHLFDYLVRISYRKVELVKTIDDVEHKVFRECLKFCNLEKDIELHNVADLPAFTGLGSSSAFTVSLLQALHNFKGEFIKPLDLAYEAIYVERHLVKDNVGCQDQLMSAVGGFNLVEFRTEENIIVNRVDISPQRLAEFESHIFIVFTGIKRRASQVVEKQLRRVEDNLETLKKMRKMVDQGWDILTSNESFSKFGELLHDAWIAKRSLDQGISNPEIDYLYELGRENGAWGGKLLGAGAGGFLLFFASPEVHPKLEQVFKNHQILSVKINSPGSQVIFS